jgi:hypothetical protein
MSLPTACHHIRHVVSETLHDAAEFEEEESHLDITGLMPNPPNIAPQSPLRSWFPIMGFTHYYVIPLRAKVLRFC